MAMKHWMTMGAMGLGMAAGCAPQPAEAELGEVSVALSTRLGEVDYRLQSGRFRLLGMENLEFEVLGEDHHDLALPAGAYRLELLDEWVLARLDGSAHTPVEATLLSQNPAGFEIRGGETTTLRLRFGLEPEPAVITTGPGALALDLEVEASDGGAAPPACEPKVVINEVDYDQTGSDDAELVEVLNAGPCSVALDAFEVELVNGNDSEVYGRYPLGDVASYLDPGNVLVLADANVLAELPADVPAQALRASGLQNGPDVVRLISGGLVVDSLAYGGELPGLGEGMPAVEDPGEGSLGRCPNGFDSQDNARDFTLGQPSPGAANVCR